jgi:large subunit ribosomal protein LP0
MPKKENKVHVFEKTKEFFKKYKNILIAYVKDISTDKIQKIRHEIISLGETETLCGKTTVIKKAIKDMVEESKGDLPKHLPSKALNEFEEAMPGIHLLLIFTNRDISEISNITGKYIIEKQAKPGQLSPVEIIIPAGPTGMDSSQIDFFQALKIPTKVMRNQLEITTATKILSVGQKITLSEINLMKKFNMDIFLHIFTLCSNVNSEDSGCIMVESSDMIENGELVLLIHGLTLRVTNSFVKELVRAFIV